MCVCVCVCVCVCPTVLFYYPKTFISGNSGVSQAHIETVLSQFLVAACRRTERCHLGYVTAVISCHYMSNSSRPNFLADTIRNYFIASDVVIHHYHNHLYQ